MSQDDLSRRTGLHRSRGLAAGAETPDEWEEVVERHEEAMVEHDAGVRPGLGSTS
jgi:hypothetical protein